MELTQSPIARAELLIRAPVHTVFEAFADPAITTKFWFTKSSGRLEPGKQIRWEWEMFGASTELTVKEIEQDKRIVIEWAGYSNPTIVEWTFTTRPDNTTFVRVTNSGFGGDGDQAVRDAIGSTEGFTLVLANLKALLEYNINLNLIADHFPDGVTGG